MSDTTSINANIAQSVKQPGTLLAVDASLRDYFAAKALPSVYAEFWRSTDSCPPDWERGLAADAYRLADAMLAAREAIP